MQLKALRRIAGSLKRKRHLNTVKHLRNSNKTQHTLTDIIPTNHLQVFFEELADASCSANICLPKLKNPN